MNESLRKQIEDLAKALLDVVAKAPEELKIEEHNFKVNSDGWTKITDSDGNEFLQNPEKDIWETIDYNHSLEICGEQLFTWDAAMRETKNAGKRMPTDKEWDEIFKGEKDNLPNIKYAGYRGTNGTYYNRSDNTTLWSSTEGAAGEAWGRFLHYTLTGVYRLDYSKAYAWSVRCLED